MVFSSKLLETAVNEVSRLPGIGRKSALRMVLHLLRQPVSDTFNLTEALTKLRNDIKYCRTCFNISDDDKCSICTSMRRDQGMICAVEDLRDVMAIEKTSQYNGLYHVIGGLISPIDGIGPSDLNVESLITRVRNTGADEVILALSPTMEGDTTALYIRKRLKETGVKVTTISRGIPIGGELEYADEITLGRSILTRISAD
ncbi:MAG: recombination mediator RecR [Bacteroidota bacterium]